MIQQIDTAMMGSYRQIVEQADIANRQMNTFVDCLRLCIRSFSLGTSISVSWQTFLPLPRVLL